MDDIQFRKLLHHLNLSWEGYRKVRKGVKKRITRHMLQLGIGGIEKYLEILDTNSDEMDECERFLTVSISRFFRDHKLWETLQRKILPEIAGKYSSILRIWSAGCASGEEPYSFKIVWESLKLKNSKFPDLEITATDINPQYIKRAKDGIYNSSSLKEMPAKYLLKYFKRLPGKKLFQIDPSLQKNIIWLEKSLFINAPMGQFQIIFLRNNLLTYYKEELRRPVINQIIDSLSNEAYLVIGSHEQLPHGLDKQLEAGPLSYVYKKIE